MASRNIPVKFTAEGVQEVIAATERVFKSLDSTLKKSQEALTAAIAARNAAQASGDEAGTLQNADKIEAESKRVSSTVQAAFRDLRVKSTKELDTLREQAEASFRAIQEAARLGLASQKDVENAAVALASKYEALDRIIADQDGTTVASIKAREALAAQEAAAAAAYNEQAQAAQRAAAVIESAFARLGIKSEASIEKLRKEAQTDFAAIANDAKSSFRDIAAAEQALNARLNELNGTVERTQGKSGGGGFAGLLGTLKGLAVTYIAFATVTAAGDAFRSLVSEGIKFNQTMQDSKLGIASLITALADLKKGDVTLKGVDALNAALPLAEDQLRKLRIAGLETAATTEQLVGAYQDALGSGLSAGLTLDQVREITVKVTNAASALGVPLNQLNQEVRALLSGDIDQNARVAKALNITGKQVKEVKDATQLFDLLNNKLEPFAVAGQRVATSFSGVVSNLKEAGTTVAGLVTSGLFEQLRVAGNKALSGIFDTKNLTISADFKAIADVIKDEFSAVGIALGDVGEGFLDTLRTASTFIEQNRQKVDEVTTAFNGAIGAVRELLSFVGALLGDLGKSVTVSGLLATTFRAAGLAAAGLQDGIEFIISEVEILGGAIVRFVLAPFQAVLATAGKVQDVFSNVSSSIAKQAEALDKLRKGDLTGAGQAAKSSLRNPFADTPGGVNTGTALNGAVANAMALQDQGRARQLRIAQGGAVARFAAGQFATFTPPERSTRILPPPGVRVVPRPATKDEKTKKPKEPKTASASSIGAIEKANAEAVFKLLKDSLERQQRLLDAKLEDFKISYKSYYTEKAKLQEADIDADIQRLQKEIATQEKIKAKSLEIDSKTKGAKDPNAANQATAKAIELTTQLIILGRKRGDVQVQAARDIARAEKEVEAAVEGVRIALLEQTNQPIQAAGARFDEQYKDLRKRLEAEGNKAALSQLDALRQQVVVVAQLSKAQNDFNLKQDERSIKESEIKNDVADGLISAETGQQRVNALNLEYARILEQQLVSLKAIAAATGDPQAILDIKRIEQELRQLKRPVDDVAKSINESLKGSFESFFTDVLTGTKGIAEAFGSLVQSILGQIAKLAAQALVKNLLGGLLGGANGTGGAGGFLSGIFAGGFAEGGLISGAGTGTSDSILAAVSNGEYVVPASTVSKVGASFLDNLSDLNVPRFATGGLVGTAGASKASAAPVNIRNVNLFDTQVIEDYVSSSAGETVILNLISQNPSAVRQAIA